MKRRLGMVVILSSPSGAGKSTLARMILAKDSEILLSVSVTTRPARRGESDGVDYYFIDQAAYDERVETGQLLEHAQVFEYGYGTPKAAVQESLRCGRDVLFDIDWQGAQQVKAALPDEVVSIFLLPPSRATLEARLRQRSTDSDAVIRSRMEKADQEISHFHEYDWVLVNDDLQETAARVRGIITAERLRLKRQLVLRAFAEGLLSERFRP